MSKTKEPITLLAVRSNAGLGEVYAIPDFLRNPANLAKERKMEKAELQELVHAALGELIDRIELCGASEKLTHAVTLAADLRQAVGNQWNTPDEYAKKRVLAVLPNVK
jgi:hypothetical protein